MAGTSEPAQHPSTDLLLGRGERLSRECSGLMEAQLPRIRAAEHPVDHAAVEMHVGIERTAEALHEVSLPPAGHLDSG